MRARSGPVSCDQSVCIRWGQCGVACFSRCDYSDPALLPSGWLSVKGAAEERHSRGCLEKSMHMLPRSLRGFRSRLPPCLFSCSFLITHRHTDSAPASDSTLLSFLACLAALCAPRALFYRPSFYPLLPLCLFMLLLLLLLDIFRDELRHTAGRKKTGGGAVSATCVPLPSFLLTFMRTSSLSCRTSSSFFLMSLFYYLCFLASLLFFISFLLSFLFMHFRHIT